MTTRSRLVLRACGVAAAAVLGLTLIGSAKTPLYDGVGFPDEPYRYLQPPAGRVTTPPPTAARGELRFAHGANTETRDFTTAEAGPQIDLFVPAKAVTVRGGAAEGVITLSLAPIPLVGPPTDGDAGSNDYHVDLAVPNARVAASTTSEPPFVSLRATAQDFIPVMVYRATPTSDWRRLETTQDGQDIFAGPWVGPGEYLLDKLHLSPAGAESSGRPATPGRSHLGLVLVLGLAALLLVLLVAVRLRTQAHAREP
jgi:hypothetical protein